MIEENIKLKSLPMHAVPQKRGSEILPVVHLGALPSSPAQPRSLLKRADRDPAASAYSDWEPLSKIRYTRSDLRPTSSARSLNDLFELSSIKQIEKRLKRFNLKTEEVFTPVIISLLNHPLLRRQAQISQMTVATSMYGRQIGADHSRLDHVMEALFYSVAIARTLKLGGKTTQEVAVGALIHDICHSPFSHALEDTLEYDHDLELARFLRGRLPKSNFFGAQFPTFKKIFKAHKIDPERISAIFPIEDNPDQSYRRVIVTELADRFAYLGQDISKSIFSSEYKYNAYLQLQVCLQSLKIKRVEVDGRPRNLIYLDDFSGAAHSSRLRLILFSLVSESLTSALVKAELSKGVKQVLKDQPDPQAERNAIERLTYDMCQADFFNRFHPLSLREPMLTRLELGVDLFYQNCLTFALSDLRADADSSSQLNLSDSRKLKEQIVEKLKSQKLKFKRGNFKVVVSAPKHKVLDVYIGDPAHGGRPAREGGVINTDKTHIISFSYKPAPEAESVETIAAAVKDIFYPDMLTSRLDRIKRLNQSSTLSASNTANLKREFESQRNLPAQLVQLYLMADALDEQPWHILDRQLAFHVYETSLRGLSDNFAYADLI